MEVRPYHGQDEEHYLPSGNLQCHMIRSVLADSEHRYCLTPVFHIISMGVNLTHFQMPSDIFDQLQICEQKDKLTIHPSESADTAELMLFLIDHFGWDWYRHAQSYLLECFGDNPHQICFLIARLNGEIIGFCHQRGERFGTIGVREDCRGSGSGKQLLFTCLNIMRAKNVHYAYFL